MRASDSDKETGGKRKGSSINKKKVLSRDFASGPVAKTALPLYHRGYSFDPWLEN